MSKLFAVIVKTVPGYLAHSEAHPDHGQRQSAWFEQKAKEGVLVACGPFLPRDGTGLWILRTDSVTQAVEIAKESPRYTDGMLSLDDTRIVEWSASIGKERFA